VEEALICQGRMWESLGYNAVSPTEQAILARTYEYPKGLDEAMRDLCKECALIQMIIPANLVGTRMTKEDFITHWTNAKEERSSSYSGLSFLHYIAGTSSPNTSHFRPQFNFAHSSWPGPKMLGAATEDFWLLSHHEAALYPSYES
jgi:hypothetical protein